MAIEIEPRTHDFGECVIGNKASLPFTFTGTGADEGEEVQLETSSVGDGTFSVTPASGRLEAGGCLRVAVVFSAHAAGAVHGTLLVKRGDAIFARISLSGRGIAPTCADQTGGSHLLISVPDYGDTTYVNDAVAVPDGIDPRGIDGSSLHSYLRLGKFDYTRESPAAQELLKIIPKANAARDPRSPDPATEILPGVRGMAFVDDVRVRPQDTASLTTDDDPDHGLTAARRQEESRKLYDRGGWRDHSDGNRISTTWGDKVEVVRGNYKMIVLGRQNDPAQAMGWEASGGHIQDFAPGTMPGASFWLEWIDDTRYYATGAGGDGRKGAWLLVNTTENVYQFERTAGTLRSESWGDVHETYVGSENPPDASSAGRANGDAFAVDASHGTGGHAVDASIRIAGRSYLTTTPPDEHDQQGKIRSNPHIINRTWAERIDESTGTGNWRIPTIKSETWVRDTEELVDVSGVMTSNTRAATIASATTAGNIWEATTAALHGEMHVGGVHLGVELGGHVELEAGGHLSVEVALKGEIQVAGGFEIGIGELKEIRFGKKKVAFDEAKVALKESKLALSAAKSTLRSQYTSLEEKHTAMMAAITALSVNIGV